MDIDPSGLSSLRAISVPATRKDNARPSQSTDNKNPSKAPSQIAVIKQGSEPVFKQADAFRQTTEVKMSTGQKERVAIDAYESIAKEQQRQNIQMLLGVDTFV